jgi:hypothetical protein
MANSKESKPYLSFAAIAQGRYSSMRVCNSQGDVVDAVMVYTGMNCNNANEILRKLKPSLFDKSCFFVYDGRRYADLHDIMKLGEVLPCKFGMETRNKFTGIILDYIKKLSSRDDVSNQEGLEQFNCTGANAESEQPVDDMPDLVGIKRRREELGLLKIDEEIRGMYQSRIIAAGLEIERINNPARSSMDTETRLMIQKALQNSILSAF